MVNYDKSTIYKLCCKDPDIADIYIGSTTNFTRRKNNHKSKCTNENDPKYNLRVYETIRDFGGWENWDMVQVEKYCATDIKDLHSRERFWLEELGATLNKQIPNQSKAEYRAEYQAKNKDKIAEYRAGYYAKNKDKIAEYHAEYNAKNKDKKAEYDSEYRAKNKDKIAEYRAKNKDKIAEYQAEYRAKNKDKRAEYDTEYRAKNKDKIKEKASEKVQCGCGSVVTKGSLSQHRKTKKHQKWVEENSES